LIFLIGLAACGNRNGGGIRSGTGGIPGPGSSPAEVSSSSEVVTVEPAPLQIAEGGSADAIVKLAIRSGYHINANPATYPYLIATEVQPDLDPNGFCATPGKPIYPPAVKSKFEFAEDPLAVYEGSVQIKLPIKLPRTEAKCLFPSRGTRGSIPIKVRVQACDHEKCFPPANINAAIPVEVN
jgi:hypothetical protein